MRFLLACVFPMFAAAQAPILGPEITPRVIQVMQHIYELDYGRAEEACKRMIASMPSHPAGYVYLARTIWSEELNATRAFTIERFAAPDFFSESPKWRTSLRPEAERRFRDAAERSLTKAKEYHAAKPQDPAALFLLGIAYQNMASFEAALKRNWWSAFRLASKAHRYHEELNRIRPDSADALLTLGVSEYTAGSLPWKINWLAFVLGYQGSKEKGKQTLESAVRKAEITADDARTFLVLLYTREKDFEKAYSMLAELHKRHPRNYLVHLDMGTVAARLGRGAEAVRIYSEVLNNIDKQRYGYQRLERAIALNRLGVATRAVGDLDASARYLRRARDEKQASGRSRQMTHLELGKTLDLLGRREEAVAEYRAVLAAEDVGGFRPEAERLLRRPYDRRAVTN